MDFRLVATILFFISLYLHTNALDEHGHNKNKHRKQVALKRRHNILKGPGRRSLPDIKKPAKPTNKTKRAAKPTKKTKRAANNKEAENTKHVPVSRKTFNATPPKQENQSQIEKPEVNRKNTEIIITNNVKKSKPIIEKIYLYGDVTNLPESWKAARNLETFLEITRESAPTKRKSFLGIPGENNDFKEVVPLRKTISETPTKRKSFLGIPGENNDFNEVMPLRKTISETPTKKSFLGIPGENNDFKEVVPLRKTTYIKKYSQDEVNAKLLEFFEKISSWIYSNYPKYGNFRRSENEDDSGETPTVGKNRKLNPEIYSLEHEDPILGDPFESPTRRNIVNKVPELLELLRKRNDFLGIPGEENNFKEVVPLRRAESFEDIDFEN